MAFDKIVDSTQLDSDLTSIANAIRTKGGTSAQLNFPEEFVNAIDNIKTGGSVESKDVNFIDYTGDIVDSYSAAEFLNLTDMPALPVHTGLTQDGWNWTLADAKAYVTNHGFLDIGAMYKTDDGTTRIHLELLNPTEIALFISLSGTAEIDWGDGSPHDTQTDSMLVSHRYTQAGEYVIKIAVEGRAILSGSSTWWGDWIRPFGQDITQPGTSNYEGARSLVTKIEIGDNMQFDSYGYSIAGFKQLKSILIPRSAAALLTSYLIYSCTSIKGIVLPSGVTTIPDHIVSYSSSLERISIPYGVQELSANAFTTATVLRIAIPDTVSIAGTGALSNLSRARQIALSNNGHAAEAERLLLGCSDVRNIQLPEGTTVVKKYLFTSCYSVEKITLPSTITTIEESALQNVYNLRELHVKATTPPSIYNSLTIYYTPAFMRIYVPYSADHSILAAYQAATNWSAYAAQIIEEDPA